MARHTDYVSMTTGVNGRATVPRFREIAEISKAIFLKGECIKHPHKQRLEGRFCPLGRTVKQ